MSALTDALDYIQRGWYPVPIPFRRKGPVISGWQNLRLTAQDAPTYFNQQPLNIGVLLGVSSGLADVDLDCSEAIAVAPWFLPADTSRFGRASAPGSHWLFVSNIQADRSSIEFTDPRRINPTGQPEMIVELRVGGDRHAAQSVFPHSVHPDGEAIEWEQPHHDPQTLAEEQLKAAVRKIACAALLVRYWPSKGGRHSTSLALGGFLRRLGWDVPTIKTFVDAVVRSAGDPRPGQRVRDAEDAAGKVDRNERVYGLPKLTERLGRDIADTLAKWLGYAAASSAAAGHKAGDTARHRHERGYGSEPSRRSSPPGCRSGSATRSWFAPSSERRSIPPEPRPGPASCLKSRRRCCACSWGRRRGSSVSTFPRQGLGRDKTTWLKSPRQSCIIPAIGRSGQFVAFCWRRRCVRMARSSSMPATMPRPSSI